ncbi:MAG: glycosyltransferase [Cyanobacteria bacterium P01_F01_bin.150]
MQLSQAHNPIIIIGMHRSGTSLIASLLQSGGLNIGENLMHSGVGNAKGHFENLDFYTFHRSVLQSKGIHPDGWTLENNICVSHADRQKAQGILARNASVSPWGWKDPRTVLFLDFWLELFPNANLVMVYREPWAVVDSLYRRGTDRIFLENPKRSVDYWIHYNERILACYKKFSSQSFLFRVDRCVNNINGWIGAINKKLGYNFLLPNRNIFEKNLLKGGNRLDYHIDLFKTYFIEATQILTELEKISWQSDNIHENPEKSDVVKTVATSAVGKDIRQRQNKQEHFLQDWFQLRHLQQSVSSSNINIIDDKDLSNREIHQRFQNSNAIINNADIFPKIDSVFINDESDRPFLSVMIPTFNPVEDLFRKTLHSLLAQQSSIDFNHLQIEVVDDASTEIDVESIVYEVGHGKIHFFQQPQNIGLIDNWNYCLKIARGKWIHLLHQDDIILAGFYGHLKTGIERASDIGAAFCRHFHIDRQDNQIHVSTCERANAGVLENWLERIAVSQRIQFASILVKREVYENIGGFCQAARSAADWEMWQRIATYYPVWYEPEPLACFRKHNDSESSRLIATAENVSDARCAISVAQSYLPAHLSHKVQQVAVENLAFCGLNLADSMWKANNFTGSLAHLKQALACSNSQEVNNAVLSLLTEWENNPKPLNFYQFNNSNNPPSSLERSREFGIKVIIDGVFFQLYQTGIARVWKSLLEIWATTSFASHLLVLDRNGTAPRIEGIPYRTIAGYSYQNTKADRQLLESVCQEEGAALFISTYYTTPLKTPSAFMAYDMIPEVMSWDLNLPMWQEKHHAIQQASYYLSISQSTAKDLAQFYPAIDTSQIKVALCGVSDDFSPSSEEDIRYFKAKYGINKPYYILVGAGRGVHSYKNPKLFFEAFANLATRLGFEVICTGTTEIDPVLREMAFMTQVHALQLSDEELRKAYSGAVAMVYPSKYEGFGLPIVEAMACGCPVITSPNASIPEVAGDAALYVDDSSVDEMVNALCEVQKPSLRQSLINAGLEQAKRFSWDSMAAIVQNTLLIATLPFELKPKTYLIFPDWSVDEDLYGEAIQRVIYTLSQHPQSDQVMLLIENSDMDAEDINLLISGIAMNLMMKDINLEESIEIAVTGNLTSIQWQALFHAIESRIILPVDNTAKVEAVKENCLSSCNLEGLIEMSSIQE